MRFNIWNSIIVYSIIVLLVVFISSGNYWKDFVLTFNPYYIFIILFAFFLLVVNSWVSFVRIKKINFVSKANFFYRLLPWTMIFNKKLTNVSFEIENKVKGYTSFIIYPLVLAIFITEVVSSPIFLSGLSSVINSQVKTTESAQGILKAYTAMSFMIMAPFLVIPMTIFIAYVAFSTTFNKNVEKQSKWFKAYLFFFPYIYLLTYLSIN
ncbi:hypothetical protein MCAV_01670 [[Mycoplasma] cavipharyngis]|uniref:hypothetical protein n=1 Tax=[Mycoplasma] cavipharyngis TaxID=92757 RepID=UPI003703A5A2